MYTAAGGIRFIYDYKFKPATLTQYYPKMQVAYTKKGEDFGAQGKEAGMRRDRRPGDHGRHLQQLAPTTSAAPVAATPSMPDPAKIIAEYEKKKKKK